MNQNKILKRERIETELNNIFKYPLTIVSATMGYGKTTSVRTYLNNYKARTIWIPVLGCDGMEDIFWHKLSSEVHKINSKMGKQLDILGFPLDAQQSMSIIDFIQEFNDGAQTVIVIDDYHIIEQNKQIGNLVELIIQEKISNLHIVLITRTRPKLNHINLVSKGLCYYLDTSVLAFTQQEIKDYLDFMNFHSTPEEIRQINQYTKGWISAIYLLLLGLRQGVPLTEVSNINLLVANNLFNTLDEQTKQTLLSLSVLDNFTIQQAIAVLQNKQVPKIIEKLVEQNAFVTYDQQTKVYTLHNVLLDFLRQKVATEGEDIRPICHRAGKWFWKHDDIRFAFEYYYRARKIEELLSNINQIEKICISSINIDLLKKIYFTLSKEQCIMLPFPLLQFAGVFIICGDETTIPLGREIINILQEYYSAENGTENLQNKILGEIEVIKIFLVFNDAEKMVEHSLKAKNYLGDGVSSVIYWHSEFTFGLPHFLYAYYKETGKLKETVDCILNSFPPYVFDGCGTGCDYIVQAEYALEKCNMQNAELFAKKAIYKAGTKQQYAIILCADFTLMRLYLLQGNTKQALELLNQTKDWLEEQRPKMTALSNTTYNTTIAICEGYIYGCLKMQDNMPDWLCKGDLSEGSFMFQGLAFPCIIHGKAIMLSENWIELEVLCESFYDNYAIFNNQFGIFHNAVYEAVSKYHLYGIEEGIAVLLPALKAAQSDGVLLPFVENADFILPMLYKIQEQNELNSEYLTQLITLCEQYSKSLSSLQLNTPILSEKEIEVLHMIAQGLTQKEIANKLCLSVSGVKRYFESIYEKLCVNNKLKAVKKAQELNIF